jgi:hypothetical protein
MAEPLEPAAEAERVVGPVAVPEPIHVNADRIIFIGTALWTLSFLILLPFYSELGRHHHRIWLWTSLAGIGVGLFGYSVMRRHRAAGRTT